MDWSGNPLIREFRQLVTNSRKNNLKEFFWQTSLLNVTGNRKFERAKV